MPEGKCINKLRENYKLSAKPIPKVDNICKPITCVGVTGILTLSSYNMPKQYLSWITLFTLSSN